MNDVVGMTPEEQALAVEGGLYGNKLDLEKSRILAAQQAMANGQNAIHERGKRWAGVFDSLGGAAQYLGGAWQQRQARGAMEKALDSLRAGKLSETSALGRRPDNGMQTPVTLPPQGMAPLMGGPPHGPSLMNPVPVGPPTAQSFRQGRPPSYSLALDQLRPGE